MRFVYLFIILIIFSKNLSAQPQPLFEILPENAPKWLQMIHSERPNWIEIEKNYQNWSQTQPVEKSTLSQFYKRWKQWARPFSNADGSILMPSEAEISARENQLFALRNERNSAANPWVSIGPKLHLNYEGAGKEPISRHTNIYAFDIFLGNSSILYAGGETGGLWKTTDKGQNWQSLTNNLVHGSFGAVKIHPSNSEIVIACTGGKIIRTTDGGQNWATVLSATNLWVNEFAWSVTDHNVVVAASDQGLYRSADAGVTWTKIFTQKTWCVKGKIGDGATFFAVRKNSNSSQFVQTTDFGQNWTQIGTGWYSPPVSTISVTGAHLGVCASNPSKIYAYLCGEGGTLNGYIGVFVSGNSGLNWTNTNPQNSIGTPYSIPAHVNLMDANGVDWFDQGFYDMGFVVNPMNENELIAGGCSWWRSTDGGKTWNGIGGYVNNSGQYRHPDFQSVVWLGNDLWIGSDGGLDHSTNGGTTFTSKNNGINGVHLWGFDTGWNEDILVGGRYHNGNMAYHESFPKGDFMALGGAEAATGYVNPSGERKVYFSDIGGRILPNSPAGTVKSFSFSQGINESYAYFANSEITFHPHCWNICWLGFENKLWKSYDGGLNFKVDFTFPGTADNEVYEIEISRSNPDRMFCTQWDGSDDAIWRSSDGGISWTKCSALVAANNNERTKIALSSKNPDEIWAAVTYGSNGKKVFKSLDGGQTWQNLTSSKLNNIQITDIAMQYGTDGGVWLGGIGAVFYRNNSMTDWLPVVENLPMSAEPIRIKPFYKKAKMRNGTAGFGVWETDFIEKSGVEPLAMCDKLDAFCSRDTFFFDDKSVVEHNSGTSWAWEFPGADQVFGQNTRNPKVIFGKNGNFSARMTLTTPDGVFRDTIFNLKINSACEPDSVRGMALKLDGSGDRATASQPLNFMTDTLTAMCWIKWNGAQSNRAGIIFWRGNSAHGLGFDGNRLSYHWNNAGWGWNSGLVVPQNEWCHVALVAEPTRMKLYLNGVEAVENVVRGVANFNVPVVLGEDPNGGGRFFNGLIDEVAIFRRALTREEIREQMHLVRSSLSDFENRELVSYYQFNEKNGPVNDRILTRHANLAADAVRISSTAPVGAGVFSRKNVAGNTKFWFKKTGLIVKFAQNATLPNGEMVVTRLHDAPDTIPTWPKKPRFYWILENWGTNSAFSKPVELEFDALGSLPQDLKPENAKLFSRNPRADGFVWVKKDSADLAVPSGKLTFKTDVNLTAAAQLHLQFGGWLPANFSENSSFLNEKAPETAFLNENFVKISPNPATVGQPILFEISEKSPAKIFIFDENGKLISRNFGENQLRISTENWKNGRYFYKIHTETRISSGVFFIF